MKSELKAFKYKGFSGYFPMENNWKESDLHEKYLLCFKQSEWVSLLRTEKIKTLETPKSKTRRIISIDGNQTIGMGRLIGDGMYYMIADIVVHPNYQKQGIGTKIISMIIEYVDRTTPIGGRSSIQLIAEKGEESHSQVKYDLSANSYHNHDRICNTIYDVSFVLLTKANCLGYT